MALAGATACTTAESSSEGPQTAEDSPPSVSPEESPEPEEEPSEPSEPSDPDSDAAAAEQGTLTASDVEEGNLLDIPALSHLGGTAQAVGAGPGTVDVRLDGADLSILEPVYGLRATGQQKFNPTADQVCAGVEDPGLPDGIDLHRVDASDGASITGDHNPGSSPAVIACTTDADLEEVTEQMLAEAVSASERSLHFYVPYEHIEKQ